MACLWALVAVAVYSLMLGPHLGGSLAGPGDVSIWESMGYYLSKHLHLGLLPRLDLVNDQAFFPYGGNHVFQPWGFERDGFFALAFTLAGPGPWLQLYYLASVFVTLVCLYWLLRPDFGGNRAAAASVLVTFFNFYAFHKYPGHLHVCIVHWTVLGVAADFVITRRIVLARPVSLRLVLVRATLLSLALGQDLGYIAGLSLTSFSLSLTFVLLVLLVRAIRRRLRWREALQAMRAEDRRVLALLLAAFLVASWFYGWLAFTIAREASRFDFSVVPPLYWYASPFRLLLPYFPGFNPVYNGLAEGWRDLPEGLGGGAVGWTFLVFALLGLWGARRTVLIHVPLAAMFALCVYYHPRLRPTLSVFPWFSFSRVGDRTTVIYPAILALVGLSAPRVRWDRSSYRIAALALMALATLELRTSLSLATKTYYRTSREFLDYMATVRRQPGAAVLDWPFCLIGGNGVGREVCPYYAKNREDFTYALFHRKKVVGQYFGRLHPDQLADFKRARWDLMFAPNSPDVPRMTRQARCFTDEEWTGFTSFFTLNDFAGIQLHESLLPPSCIPEFYRRFGQPIARAMLPEGDNVSFIPKSAALHAQEDPARGRQLVLLPYRELEPVDFLKEVDPRLVRVEGLSWIEADRRGAWRWGIGPTTTLEFSLAAARPVTIRLAWNYPRTVLDLRFNGEVVKMEGAAVEVPFTTTVAGRPGVNTLEILSPTWNGKGGRRFGTRDPRAISVRWTQLALEPR